MKVVLAGLTGFGNAALRSLLAADCRPIAVLGGKRHPGPYPYYRETALATECAERGVPYVEYEALAAGGAAAASLGGAELLIVSTFDRILDKTFLARFPAGALGIHPSSLPRYRGSTPVYWALRQGERRTAWSVFRISARVDAGPVLHRREVEVSPDETHGTLLRRVAASIEENLGPLVASWLDAGQIPPGEPQIESEASAFPHRDRAPEGRLLSLLDGPKRAFDHARALLPYPGALVDDHGTTRPVRGARLRRGDSAVMVGERGPVCLTDETGRLEVFASLTAEEERAVLAANIEFHSHLATRWEEQPYYDPENRRRVREILESLARRTGAGRLLDLGCGTGFISELAHDLFAGTTGIDVTEAMLRRATARPNVHLAVATAERLPFPDETFDVVTAHTVLHHLPDSARVFAEVRRVLRPGGHFYADESPSAACRAAIASLGPDEQLSAVLRNEVEATRRDPERYRAAYGIPEEVTRTAMIRLYQHGGLDHARVRGLMLEAGFRTVEIRPRWFLGRGAVAARGGAEAGRLVEQVLLDLLPLTQGLFKYTTILAEA